MWFRSGSGKVRRVGGGEVREMGVDGIDGVDL